MMRGSSSVRTISRPQFGVATPPVVTLENQHIESLARRVGELLESIARKLLTALDFARRQRARCPSESRSAGSDDPREQGRKNR